MRHQAPWLPALHTCALFFRSISHAYTCLLPRTLRQSQSAHHIPWFVKFELHFFYQTWCIERYYEPRDRIIQSLTCTLAHPWCVHACSMVWAQRPYHSNSYKCTSPLIYACIAPVMYAGMNTFSVSTLKVKQRPVFRTTYPPLHSWQTSMFVSMFVWTSQSNQTT